MTENLKQFNTNITTFVIFTDLKYCGKVFICLSSGGYLKYQNKELKRKDLQINSFKGIL